CSAPASPLAQPAVERLPAGPNAAFGHRGSGLVAEVAGRRDLGDEVAINGIGVGANAGTSLLVERDVVGVQRGIAPATDQRFAHADAIVEAAQVSATGNDTNRTGDGSGLRQYRGAGERDVVSARRGNVTARHDDGFGIAGTQHLAPGRAGAEHRAARAGDANDQRADVVSFAHLFQRRRDRRGAGGVRAARPGNAVARLDRAPDVQQREVGAAAPHRLAAHLTTAAARVDSALDGRRTAARLDQTVLDLVGVRDRVDQGGVA